MSSETQSIRIAAQRSRWRTIGRGTQRAVKAVVIVACLLPFVWLILRTAGIAGSSLGANPVQEVLHTLGKTGLNLLMLSLAITPARILTGFNWLVTLRRSVGLFAFFYLVLHMLAYAGLDQRFDWPLLIEDVVERPFITFGFVAVLLMVPLAITSTNAMQRRLRRNWKRLHRLVYVIAPLGVTHFVWQGKGALVEPWIYAGVLALLLGFRVVRALPRRINRL